MSMAKVVVAPCLVVAKTAIRVIPMWVVCARFQLPPLPNPPLAEELDLSPQVVPLVVTMKLVSVILLVLRVLLALPPLVGANAKAHSPQIAEQRVRHRQERVAVPYLIWLRPP